MPFEVLAVDTADMDIYPGALLGYRQWTVNLQTLSLCSLSRSQYAWQPGVNHSECNFLGIGIAHQPPARYCECGLYAYHQLERITEQEAGYAPLLTGAVAGAGGIQIQPDGFRAGEMQVMALLAPDDPFRLPPQAIDQLARRYRVPVMQDPEDLISWAERFAGSAPNELRPLGDAVDDAGAHAELMSGRSLAATAARKLLKNNGISLTTAEHFQIGVLASSRVLAAPMLWGDDPLLARMHGWLRIPLFIATNCHQCHQPVSRHDLLQREPMAALGAIGTDTQIKMPDWLACPHCGAASDLAGIGWLSRCVYHGYNWYPHDTGEIPPVYNSRAALSQSEDTLYLVAGAPQAWLAWSRGRHDVIAYTSPRLALRQIEAAVHLATAHQRRLVYVEHPHRRLGPEVKTMLADKQIPAAEAPEQILGTEVPFVTGLTLDEDQQIGKITSTALEFPPENY